MHAPPILDFSINEIVFMLGCSRFSANFDLLFYRPNIIVLTLYIDEFIIVGSLEQFMMWREKILTSENVMEDKGGWYVVDAMFLVPKVLTLKILKNVQQ